MTNYYGGAGEAAPYSDSASLSNLIKTAYDQRIRLAFRSQPLFRQFADTKVINGTQPGATVVFHIHKELAPVTAPLGEINDGDGTQLSDPTPITVTVREYGNYTIYTEALSAFAFDDALAKNISTQIANNLADSVDKLVTDVLLTTDSNLVESSAGVVSTVENADLATTTVTEGLTAKTIRHAVAELRSNNVPARQGNKYVVVTHPRVASQFRASIDAASWREATLASTNIADIVTGTTGDFEGVTFVETPRAPFDAVSGTYTSFVFGAEALAEVVSKEFSVVVDGDIPDVYGRKTAIGWYGIAGWALFRPESMFAIKTVLA